MSGVLIDVNTRSESAKKDLRDLNKSLAQMIANSNKSGQSLDKISASSFKELTDELRKTNNAIKEFGINSQRAFSNTTKDISSMNSSMAGFSKTIKGVLITAASLASALSFTAANDNLINIQNRLKLVTSSTEDLINTQNLLYKLSKETRSSFEGVVRLYSDFSSSLKSIGISEERIFKVVKTIQQSAVLSGSSMDATNAALVQLSQGISSGTLRGEELNSVLEQMPYLGQAIAKQLGMTTGTLRKFAAEGGLSAKTLLTTIEKIYTSTDRDFNKTVITFSSAFQGLATSMKLFIAEAGAYGGLSLKLINLTLTLTNAIDIASNNIFGLSFLIDHAFSKIVNSIKSTALATSAVYGISDRIASTMKSISYASNELKKFNVESLSISEIYSKLSSIFVKVADSVQITIDYVTELKSRLISAKSELKEFWADLSDITPATFIKDLSTESSALNVLDELKTKFYDLKSAFLSFTGAISSADFVKLFTEVIKTGMISLERIVGFMPVLKGAVFTAFTDLEVGFYDLVIDANAFLYKALMPLARGFEGLAEAANGYIFQDRALERSFVRLFQVKNINDFTVALKDFNHQLLTTKFDNFNYFFKEDFSRPFKRYWLYPIQDILINLGLMDNKLLRIRDTRFDRIQNFFINFGKTVSRAYSDIIAPNLEPLILKALIRVRAFVETFVSSFYQTFNFNKGATFANLLVSGVKSGIESVLNYLDGIEPGSIANRFLKLFDVKAILIFLKNALLGIVDFIKGFIGTLYVEIKNSLNINEIFNTIVEDIKSKVLSVKIDYNLGIDKSLISESIILIDSLFLKIKQKSESVLPKVKASIQEFANFIKDSFYDIWDKIVGHSYWPDTIDGVVDYTNNLSKAISKISEFSKSIITKFSKIYEDISGKVKESTIASDIIQSVKTINFSEVYNTAIKNMSSLAIAAFIAVFGSGKLKLTLIGFLGTIFNGSLNSVLSLIIPGIANVLAKGGGDFAGKFVKGFIEQFDILLGQLPNFIASFSKALLPLPDMIAESFNNFHFINNTILHGILAITAAYALFADKGFKTVKKFIKFGDFTKQDTPFAYARSLFKNDYSSIGADIAKGITDKKKLISTAFKTAINAVAFDENNIFEKIFVSPKLALAAAAVFTTALLESVTLVEAFEVGAPLLAWALFGKDGGTRIIKDTFELTGTISGIVYRKLVTELGSLLGKDNPLVRLMDAPFEYLKTFFKNTTNQTKTAKGPLTTAFMDLFSGAFTSLKNLKKNAEAYGAGLITMSEAMENITPATKAAESSLSKFNKYLISHKSMTKFEDFFKIPEKQELSMSERFSNLMSEIGKIKIGDTSLNSIFTPLREGFSKNYNKLKDIIKNGKLTETFLNIFSKLKDAVKRKFEPIIDLMMDGLKGVFSILKNKFSLGAILMAFSGAASAVVSFTDAFKVTGESISTVIKSYMAMTLGIFTLLGVIGFARRGLYAYDKAVEKAIKSAALLNTELSQSDKIRAGLGGLFSYLNKSIESIKTWPNKIKENATKIKDFLVKAFDFGRDAAKNIKSTFTNTILPLLSRLKGPLLIAAGAIAVGGFLYTWIFGDGTVFEKLGFVYDKLKEIIGLQPTSRLGRQGVLETSLAPMQIGERKVDFSRQLSTVDFEKMSTGSFIIFSKVAEETKNTLDNLQELYIKQGNLTDAQLAELDKLLETQARVISKAPQRDSKGIADTLSKVLDNYLKVDNSFSGRIRRIFDMMYNSVAGSFELLGMMFKKYIFDFSGLYKLFKTSYESFINYLIKKTQTLEDIRSMADHISAWIQPFKDLSDAIPNIPAGLEQHINELADYFEQRFNEMTKAMPEQDALAQYRKMQESFATIRENMTDLPIPLQDALDALLRDVENKWNRLKALEEAKAPKAEINLAKADYERAASKVMGKSPLTGMTAPQAFGLDLKNKKDLEAFNKRFTDLKDNAKTYLDLDLGENAKELIGSESDIKRFESLINTAKTASFELLNPKHNTLDTELRRSLLTTQRLAKAIAAAEKERMDAQITIPSQLEFQIKVLGDEQYKDSIESLRNTNIAAYEDFVNLTNSIDTMQTQLNNFNADGSVKDFEALRVKITEAKNAAIAKLPASNWIDSLNSKLQAISVENITKERFALFNENQVNELNSFLKSIKTKEEELAVMRRNGKPFSEQINKLQEILNLAKKIKSFLSGTYGGNLNQVLSDSTKTRGQKLEALKTENISVDPNIIMKGNNAIDQSIELYKQNNEAMIALADTANLTDDALIKQAGVLYSSQKALELLAEVTISTVDDIISSFGDLNISISKLSFSRASKNTRAFLISIGDQILAIDRVLNSTKANEGSVALIKQREALLQKASDVLIKTSQNTSEGITNSLSKLGISEESQIANLSESMINSLLGIDRYIEGLRFKIKNALNVSEYLEGYKKIKEVMNSVKHIVDVLNIKEAFFNSVKDGMTEGAKAAFEKFKTLSGKSNFDFKDFLGIDKASRQQINKRLSALDAISKLVELPNKTDKEIELIKKFSEGMPPESVIKELSDQNVLLDPVWQQVNYLRQINDGVKILNKQEPTNKSTDQTYDPTIVEGNKTDNAASYDESKVYNRLENSLTSTIDTYVDSAISSTKDGFKKLRIVFAKNNETIGQEWLTASDSQLQSATNMSTAIYDINQALTKTDDPEVRRQLGLSITQYQTSLNDLKDLVVQQATAAQTAGISFASEMASGFKDGFKSLLKGETDFKGFLTGILDKFTSGIIDSFVEGLSKPFTDNMDSIFKRLGSSLYDIGAKAFSGLSDMFSGMGGSGGLFSSLGFATGGWVSGPGTGTSDSIPAMLSNKEFVVNAKSAAKFGPLLTAINTGKIGHLAAGGVVSGADLTPVLTSPKSVDLKVSRSNDASKAQQVINLNITGDISRQTRNEIYKMMPQIASGVNTQNKERGYRG